jgi:hypothetical protein
MLLRCGIFDRLQRQGGQLSRGGLAATMMLTESPTDDIVRSNQRRATPKPTNDSQPDFPI